MALEFYFADPAVEEARFWENIYGPEKQPLGEMRGCLEMHEFEKLRLFWETMSQWDIEAHYFTDFYLPLRLLPKMRSALINLEEEIAVTKPFYHPTDSANPYKRTILLLDEAVASSCCLVAFCD